MTLTIEFCGPDEFALVSDNLTDITIDERLRNLGYTHRKSPDRAYASVGKHEVRDPQGNVVGHFTAGEACELLASLGG